jgi:predicted Fe-Mo cluster-binding NifX family protein
MKIVVSAYSPGLDGRFSPLFGRCAQFVFIDTDTMVVESQANSAVNQAGGAGIQAAQTIVNAGVSALITGHVGPNAHRVLQAAKLPIYEFNGATVREALEAFQSGRLQAIINATVAAHNGQGG